jgi:hypothetical protein
VEVIRVQLWRRNSFDIPRTAKGQNGEGFSLIGPFPAKSKLSCSTGLVQRHHRNLLDVHGYRRFLFGRLPLRGSVPLLLIDNADGCGR